MQPSDSPDIAAHRRPRVASILDGRVSIADLATETSMCERTVRNELDRLMVPYIKFCNVRWYARDDVRAALIARTVSKVARGRGRPARQHAA